MKTIELFEKAMTEGNEFFKEHNINPTLFTAYRQQKDSGNEMLDFSEVIWTQDIEPISDFFKVQGKLHRLHHGGKENHSCDSHET